MLKKHIKLNLSKHHITVSNEDKIKLETALDCMRQVAFSVKFEVCRVLRVKFDSLTQIVEKLPNQIFK
jgi:hypothetical protein